MVKLVSALVIHLLFVCLATAQPGGAGQAKPATAVRAIPRAMPLAVGQYTTHLVREAGSDKKYALTCALVGRDDSSWTLEIRFMGVPMAQGRVVGLEEALSSGVNAKARLVAHRGETMKWRESDSFQDELQNFLQRGFFGPVMPAVLLVDTGWTVTTAPRSFTDCRQEMWTFREKEWRTSEYPGEPITCVAWRSPSVPLSGIVRSVEIRKDQDDDVTTHLLAYGNDIDTGRYARYYGVKHHDARMKLSERVHLSAQCTAGQYVTYAETKDDEIAPAIVTLAIVEKTDSGWVLEYRERGTIHQFHFSGLERARRIQQRNEMRLLWGRSQRRWREDGVTRIEVSRKESDPKSEVCLMFQRILDEGLLLPVPAATVEAHSDPDKENSPNEFDLTNVVTWNMRQGDGNTRYTAWNSPVVPLGGVARLQSLRITQQKDKGRPSSFSSDSRELFVIDFGDGAKRSF